MSSFLTNAEVSYSGFQEINPHLFFSLFSSTKVAKQLFRKHLPSGVNFFTYSNTWGFAAFAASSTNEIIVQLSAGTKLRHDGFVLFQMQLTDFAQEVFLWSWNTESLQPILIHINQRKQITREEQKKSPSCSHCLQNKQDKNSKGKKPEFSSFKRS